MAKYKGTPPFLPKIFFPKWLEMDLKHNFIKCNILTRETPPKFNICYIFFFFEGVPNSL